MANIRGSVCRLCRREGLKLFLKGARCYTEKCAIERRNFAPGQHGKRRVKLQGYGVQLREKQKVKRLYRVLEKPFRLAFQEASRKKGVTGELLLINLERRLDNVVYRLGFTASRAQARQFVSHGHVRVDGRKVDIPSYLVRAGQVIAPKAKMEKHDALLASFEQARARGFPQWLSVDTATVRGTVASLPRREDVTMPIQEQLIVELYSK
ncbi:MAG TPA: 30S ribosomal protein S4 [Candidatus Polarisedimenticolia bacterium]|nr:30S ribosomal protein S4 [Candidatus Polarisedimenticolia bacterium]